MLNYAFQFALIASVAFGGYAHFAVDATGGGAGGMMRREPKPAKGAEAAAPVAEAHEATTVGSNDAKADPGYYHVDAQGHQILSDRATPEKQQKGASSMAETESSKKAEKQSEAKAGEEGEGAPVEKAENDIKDDAPKDEKRVEIPEGNGAGSTLTQQEQSYDKKHGVFHQRGVDMTVKNPAKLSDEEEDLYYKLFPEERESEGKAAVSALEQSGQKAFRIKVPVSGGKRLCLTEDNAGYKVRAEPCRRGSHRQKWYWMGAKLKNLHSKGRCLGLVHNKQHVSAQASPKELESLLQGETNMDNAKHLSMAFYCTNAKAPLGWGIDAQGRLKSQKNSQCMAINEHENFNALVLPCEEIASK